MSIGKTETPSVRVCPTCGCSCTKKEITIHDVTKWLHVKGECPTCKEDVSMPAEYMEPPSGEVESVPTAPPEDPLIAAIRFAHVNSMKVTLVPRQNGQLGDFYLEISHVNIRITTVADYTKDIVEAGIHNGVHRIAKSLGREVRLLE